MARAKKAGGASPMAVERLPIGSVFQDPANARKHPTRNLEGIKSSLVRFGQQTPIVVDANGICRKGNGTLLAARELGWESILGVRTKLEGTEAAAYAIADNRTSDLAEWDDQVLAESLRSFQSEDFPIEDIGYTPAEVDAMLERFGDKLIDDAEDAEAPEDFPEKGEDIETDYKCPKCGYEWSGKAS